METLSSSGSASSSLNKNSIQPWEEFNSGERVWHEFLPREQEAIVRHFAPKVKFIALRLKSKLPQHIELNELISAGTLGLMESFGKFEASLGNKFETYAENRIRGAMLDELRRLDWFPRSLRKKVRMLDEAIHKLEGSSSATPSESELMELTGLNLDEVREGLEAMQNQFCLSLDIIQETVSGDGVARETQPYSQTAFSETVDKLTELIEDLTPREKLVLSLYYTEELTMRETAEVMDITEGRVSQLHSQALARLRKNFVARHGTTVLS